MQNVDLGRGKVEGGGEISSPCSDLSSNDGDDGGGHKGRESDAQGGCSSVSGRNDGPAAASPAEAVLGIVISQPEEDAAPKAGAPKSVSVGVAADKDDKLVAMMPAKKAMARSESYHEECRVCQQQSDEPLMDLGCRCRGELAKAHLSCIEMWFRTRGSNKCEICQQVAANVPSPESQPSTNYWIWRVDPAFGGPNMGRAEQERVLDVTLLHTQTPESQMHTTMTSGCFSPLWVAFFILIGGLLLDVLISVSLGVSALPVNIIIGVLIVLGLGTALRLALECCQEWSTRRSVQRNADTAVNSGYHPDV